MAALRETLRRIDRYNPTSLIVLLTVSLLAAYAGIAVLLWKVFGDPFYLAPPLEAFQTPAPQPGRPPLADVVNWALYSITHTLYGPLVFHVLASLFTFAACAAVLRRAASSNLPIAIFYLFFLTHILFHFEVFALRDTIPFTACMAGFVYAACLPRSSRRAAGMGLFAGLGWMTRATGVLFIPWIILFAWRRSGTCSDRLKEAALALTIFIVVSSPWQAVIISHEGKPSLSPFPGNGALNAVKGNNELSTSIYPWIDLDYLDSDLDKFVNQKYGGFKFSALLDYIQKRPFECLMLQVKKTLVFFAPFYTPPYDGEVVMTDDGAHALIKNPRLVTYNARLWPAYVFTAAALLGFIGFLFRMNSARPLDGVIFWMFALFILLHFLIWMETRFRLPIDPILFMGGALFYYRQYFRDGETHSTGAPSSLP
ncbi:MAG: hypothetical protein GC154_10760 [bacterium]|nr:hypothetical protein [bacterium]